MNRDVLCVLKVRHQHAAADRPRGRPIGTIRMVALVATGIWWGILYFGSRAVGWPIGDTTLLLLLGGIFLLLVLALSMATSEASSPPGNARQDSAALPRHDRRKVGSWVSSARAGEKVASWERP